VFLCKRAKSIRKWMIDMRDRAKWHVERGGESDLAVFVAYIRHAAVAASCRDGEVLLSRPESLEYDFED